MTQDLLIDRLAAAAERDPAGAAIWARSGGVASWLIAQGYGPDGKALAAEAPEPVLVLGALRAGALLSRDGVPLPAGVSVAALAACPVDAAVAERRLHITAATPVRANGGVVLRHGDLETLEQVLSG
ncbi:MAG TPA: hypothetical protein VEC14_02820 [Reyranellaceae bacterium]|nr:hypothetical protein [Reyranellaceae bacterium]